MKSNLFTLLTFFLFGCAVNTEPIRIFKSTEFISGQVVHQKFDTIKVANYPIDIYFLKHNFFLPYDLPGAFINKLFKNQKVSIWADTTGKKDYLSNWENTYTYDYLGRVINYTYSSCTVCSSIPYNYVVKYNLNEQVTQIVSQSNGDSLKFYYSSQGDVIKFERYMQGELNTEISLVK